MKPLLFLLILCACLSLKAQEIASDPLVDSLLRGKVNSNSISSYFLLRLNNSEDKAALSENRLSIIRHIKDGLYIVLLPEHLKNRFKNILPVNNYWKLSPSLFNSVNKRLLSENIPSSFSLVVTQPAEFRLALSRQNIHAVLQQEYPSAHLIIISCTLNEIMQKIIDLECVTGIDLHTRMPVEEQPVNNFNATVNKVNVVQSETPWFNGSGLRVSVKERKPDTADIDLKGRFISTPNSSGSLSSHATIMSTIIAGAGNSYYTGKGVAWGASVSSSDFSTLLPDDDADYRQYRINVQNHSYGTGIENYYGLDALAYDMSAINNPGLLHVFSSGNSGNLSSTSGEYKGIEGFANLTGSFKMAKNILTVGAVDSSGAVPPLSSKGPAYDGRIKPDLVAYGNDGSSGAAAIVSGISLLLQQAYQEKNNGNLPHSALVRSVLINSADDVYTKGPDFTSGYGNVNAYEALNTILEGRYFSGSIQQGNTKSFHLSVPENAKNLKITVAWNDPAATSFAFAALINDLDMQLFHPLSGQSWQPWVLNSFPAADSLIFLPARRRDSLNNAEQITIDMPPSGDYIIDIKGYAVNDTQDFFVSYQFDTLNSFKWTYPTHNDNLIPGRSTLLQWQTTFEEQGILEFTENRGESWKCIDSSVDLKHNYRWVLPDTFSTGILRLTIRGKMFMSDTFTISRPVPIGVGFNCADSILLYWNNSTNSNYILYTLTGKYLEPIGVYSGKDVIIKKSANPSQYYTVAPLLPNGRAGIKSSTIDFTLQGTACYFKNFLTDLQPDLTTRLTVEIGTIYQVKKIEFEKRVGNHYKILQTIEPVNSLSYYILDTFLTKGFNVYRVKIVLNDNTSVYSDEGMVYNVEPNDFLVFPSPVARGQTLNILSKNLENSRFQLFTIDGRKLIEKELNNTLEQLDVSDYRPGFYFFLITANGINPTSGKLIIQ